MTVNQLNAQRRAKKDSFNAYAKRRNCIRDIIKKIDGSLDDDVRDVNTRISGCISGLQQGLSGTKNVGTVCSSMEGVKEKASESDAQIVSCRGYLSSEVARCQQQINSLDADIKSLDNQIRSQGGTTFFWE